MNLTIIESFPLPQSNQQNNQYSSTEEKERPKAWVREAGTAGTLGRLTQINQRKGRGNGGGV